ncbi:MAG: sulfite exporter TauE/SafE family protein [Rhodospirillales bacterium]|nr:sulfite exporter TauE/SafE family protein [Rhodospirillales bacterium]
MSIYLPIADVSVNALLLVVLGGGVGVLSGILGIGGGFLLTPLLIGLGVPPPVAVASGANQVVGVSISGVLSHWRRGNVDLKMGLYMLAGGFAGSGSGTLLFKLLKQVGQVDLAVSAVYVVMLGGVGSLMVAEAGKSLLRQWRRQPAPIQSRRRRTWIQALPWRVRFRKSMLYVSLLLPLGVGFLVGFLSAIMGVGGGFIMVPAMIYLIGMPTGIAVGTSLLQTTVVTSNVTFLQAVTVQSVDVFLMIFLLVSGVIGAQFGARYAGRLPAVYTRLLMAALVLGMAGRLFIELVTPPPDVYSYAVIEQPVE